jgi:hypothetical protein
LKEDSDREFCTAGLIELRKSSKSSEAADLLLKHRQLVENLKRNGGMTDLNAIHFELLSRILIQEQNRNLNLPKWISNDTQQEIRQLAQDSLKQLLDKPAIRALLVGPIIQKIKYQIVQAALDFRPNDTLRSKQCFCFVYFWND